MGTYSEFSSKRSGARWFAKTLSRRLSRCTKSF